MAAHHEGVDNADYTTPQTIDAYHKSLGWPGIGYAFVVNRDGYVYYCGDIGTMRYHAGENNPSTVGICLTGDFTKYWPLPTQLAGAKRAIAFVRQLLGRQVPVLGHRELPGMATECPGNSWAGWKGLLL
ncbi:MAG: peptidoglycan recognition family protein [Dehalococcoidia bacterium]|nr:peptidoglycan recognition family protein [Dehalococcoidia bacterium]